MRTSKYRKKLNITSKQKKLLLGFAGACVLAGVIFFFTYYRVENVEVMESEHYSEKQVKKMVLRGPAAGNSILAPLLYTTKDTGDMPFVQGFSVTRSNRNTIVVSVKEIKAVGCIPYLDSYIYFDRNGMFIEGEKTKDDKVPFFDGIQVKRVIKGEKLPIKDTVLNTAVALSTIFAKNESIPDHIQFDSNYEISLLYGDITVNLGKDINLEDKMSRVIAILPQLSGQKGILHAENVTNSLKTITFEAEVEEVTAENWTGGYDENGEYTGDGEYDENGKYVGEKPRTALDDALEHWIGGYDEEGDYTGTGEYDVNMNYVGPPPTQDTIDAMGDWTGGYDEEGNFTGTGEYDVDGKHVGPKPEDDGGDGSGDGTDGESSDGTGDGSSDGTGDGTGNPDENYDGTGDGTGNSDGSYDGSPDGSSDDENYSDGSYDGSSDGENSGDGSGYSDGNYDGSSGDSYSDSGDGSGYDDGSGAGY